MRRFRFSIASLLVVVLFISVALAALRASTDAWDSGVLGLAVTILLTTILLAVHRTGRRRACWLGFALFGWTYLVASLIPPIDARLPTTKGLAYLHSWLPRQEPASVFLYRLLVTEDPMDSGSPRLVIPDMTGSGEADWSYSWMFTGAAPPGFGSSPGNFVRIGHSLLALVIGFIGSRLSRLLYDKNHVGIAGVEDRPSEQERRP